MATTTSGTKTAKKSSAKSSGKTGNKYQNKPVAETQSGPSAETLTLVENIKKAILKLPIVEETQTDEEPQTVEPEGPEVDGGEIIEIPQDEIEAAETFVTESLQNASKELLEILGKDHDLTRQVIKLSNASVKATYLDKIIDYVDNVDVAREMVKSRFNIWVGSKDCTDKDLLEQFEKCRDQVAKSYKQYVQDKDKVEQDWTLSGVQHLYNCYQKLPADQITSVKLVFTTKVNNGSGGLAWQGTGIIMLNYNDNNPSQIEGLFYCDKDDGNYSLTAMDITFTHEAGHQVDKIIGPKVVGTDFSNSEEFREKCGWHSFNKWYSHQDGEMLKVVHAVRDNMDSPYEEMNSEEDKELVDLLGVTIAKANVYNNSYIDGQLNEALSAIYTGQKGTPNTKLALHHAIDKIDMDQQTESPASSVNLVATENGVIQVKDNSASAALDDATLQALTQFRDKVKNIKILNHIRRVSRGANPEFSEPYSDLGENQIHCDYSGAWWSYKTSKRTGYKISKYHFANPAEAFAELYANYFVSGKGAKTPDYYKEWFEKRVVKEIKPEDEEKIANASGAEQDPTGNHAGT